MTKPLMWITALLIMAAAGSASAQSSSGLGPMAVNLGTAGPFAILSKSSTTNS